ncbi:fungal-specific transcription factor domain-containing protein [Mariannaea sp. PMI_226]|nr:fungal-specific transcription factor domain-containing protein [Mariannaea sp. PMI_226]
MPRGARSRSGCARCKSQRLKCDETWPTCGRCERLGTPCSGPMLRVRWSDKHEMLHPVKIPRPPRPVPGGGMEALLDLNAPAAPILGQDSMPRRPMTPPCEGDWGASDSSLGHLPIMDGDYGWATQFEEISTPQLTVTSGNDITDSASSSTPLCDVGQVSLDMEETRWFLNTINPPEESPVSSELDHEPDLMVTQNPAPLTNLYQIDHLVEQIHRPMKDYATVLVEYYFKDTAPILALYDSSLNPFRTTVSRLWGSSELIYFTLQSMAAAFLSNIYPQMSSVATRFRQKAISLCESMDHAAVDEKALIALFMIGGTASWFDANDTGWQHFITAKEHMQWMLSHGQIPRSGSSHTFFKNLLTCWEMFLAFIVDDDKLGLSQPCSTQWESLDGDPASILPLAQVPHPLTGVAYDAHAYLVRVGRLVRSNRRRVRAGGFVTKEKLLQLQRQLLEASELEAELFALQGPSETEVIHTGDLQTPIWHLTTLADVYRRVGLLQLYRVFPDVLLSRVNSESGALGGSSTETVGISVNDAEKWLKVFALRIIDSLRSIPAESGTKDFQPFLLVATCSELILPVASEDNITDALLGGPDPDALLECLQSAEIYKAREFLMSRLTTLAHSLPKKPIQRCIDIVRATWEEMSFQKESGGFPTTYWMDVMIKNDWETFMA